MYSKDNHLLCRWKKRASSEEKIDKKKVPYPIVFAPKFRRMAIYKEIKADIGVILRELCRRKEIEIIEAELCPDHIHMLISVPPKYSISSIMGYLLGVLPVLGPYRASSSLRLSRRS